MTRVIWISKSWTKRRTIMNVKIKYELPIFSSSLEGDPIVESKDMNIEIKLLGRDEGGRLRKISLKFNAVICYKYTSVRFTPKLFNSYDRVVELLDSEWLDELKKINAESFAYWNPKHYITCLDDSGLFQFIAQGYEVIEHKLKAD